MSSIVSRSASPRVFRPDQINQSMEQRVKYLAIPKSERKLDNEESSPFLNKRRECKTNLSRRNIVNSCKRWLAVTSLKNFLKSKILQTHKHSKNSKKLKRENSRKESIDKRGKKDKKVTQATRATETCTLTCSSTSNKTQGRRKFNSEEKESTQRG